MATDTIRELHRQDVIPLMDLQAAVSAHETTLPSFRVEGLVRAVVREEKLLVLQDDSAAVLLELPFVDEAVRAGEWVAVQGTNCSAARSRFGIRLGLAVIDNDGLHGRLLKSGTALLATGRQPVRLEWFNGTGDSTLELEYEGPGVTRRKVPDTVLWRRPAGVTNESAFEHGLDFAAYNARILRSLRDLANRDPVRQGVTPNFDLSVRARAENTALVFTGYLEISDAGLYRFYLNSDDGARLQVGQPAVSCRVIAPHSPVPAAASLQKALSGVGGDLWVELEGEVVFAGRNERGLEMELVERGIHVPVTVIEGAALFSTNLLNQRIRVAGICRRSSDPEEQRVAAIVVPGSDQIEIQDASRENARSFSSGNRLTPVAEVLRLSREQAEPGVRVKIRGAVIGSWTAGCAVQDSTSGIFVHFNPANLNGRPHVGELWEIEGRATPGAFAPDIVARNAKRLGNAPLPEPIRPTWDQLMNGSLNVQYVEIRGVLLTCSATELKLLTPEGKVTIDETGESELPVSPGTAPRVGSVVRLRGCFMCEWDLQTRRAVSGRFNLCPGVIEVEDPAPPDPFSLTAKRAADLLLFDVRASALQRTKLTGQILYTRAGEYFAQDGENGFRVLTPEPAPLQAGDLVEAVGFPKLDGPSPVLQEARIQKIGRAPLPDPVPVPPDELLDSKYDSRLVQVEATLVSDAVRPDRRTLGLQNGPRYFTALTSGPGAGRPLQVGSRLRLVGVYASASRDRVNTRTDPFALLLLNDTTAIGMLEQPPWWTVQRALAMAVTLAGALGLAFVWVTLLRRKVEVRTAQLQREIEARQRVEQHRMMEQERSRVAQDLHDELGAGLTEMGILGSLANSLGTTPDEKTGYLDQLTEKARSLVTGLDEIVWAVNPRYDSVASLAEYYETFAERFLNLAGIACRFEAAKDPPEYALDSRLRHGTFLTFKEALNNVVRHSGATEVRLKIEVAGEHLAISVADNGHGFALDGIGAGGQGLSGMRQRLQNLGGRCEIRSRAGEGTTVEFSLPLGKTVSN